MEEVWTSEKDLKDNKNELFIVKPAVKICVFVRNAGDSGGCCEFCSIDCIGFVVVVVRRVGV